MPKHYVFNMLQWSEHSVIQRFRLAQYHFLMYFPGVSLYFSHICSRHRAFLHVQSPEKLGQAGAELEAGDDSANDELNLLGQRSHSDPLVNSILEIRWPGVIFRGGLNRLTWSFWGYWHWWYRYWGKYVGFRFYGLIYTVDISELVYCLCL